MKAIIGTILVVAYFIILLRLFPAGKRTLDVFKLNPVLLPYWWKFLGLGWLVFVFGYSIAQGNFNPSTNTFLLSGMYFGLLQITFSRERDEDEYSAMIRTKSMYVAFISVFFLVGIYSAYEMVENNSFSKNAFVWFMMLFNATLIVYLIYFYYSKYGIRGKGDK